jgi:subtilisin family serine protease
VRSSALVGLVALTSLFVSPAEASPSARLVELMTPPPTSIRRHPLADGRGRVPFTVDLPPGLSAEALGLRSYATGIASGRFSPAELSSFAAQHPDLPLWVSPPARPNLNLVAQNIGVPAWLNQTGGEGTGAGVVVGVVDTGIDVTHPTFRNADGSTRIAWLLTWGPPQNRHPEVEAALGCNDPDQPQCAVYSAEDLDELLGGTLPIPEHMRDPIGHGTHVASIAAGNGQSAPGTVTALRGVAPDATLVIAAPSENGRFANDEISRGLQFIFNRADAMGLPAVANLSLGSDYGPHDGTSALERGTAAFIGAEFPGRVVVAAAGNSGGLYTLGEEDRLGAHTEIHVTNGAPADVPLVVPGAEGGDIFVWLTFRPGDEISVGVEGPDGEGWIGAVGPEDESGYTNDDIQVAVVNNLVNDNSSINPDTNSAVVAISGKWATDSVFTLQLAGRGDAQLWTVATGAGGAEAYFLRATKQGTVGLPASHPEVLAVGCTLNRLEWTSRDVGTIGIEDFGAASAPEIDLPCFFSGAGPNPLGVPKPELSAPGGLIAAAMAVDASPDTNDDSIFDTPGCPTDDPCYVVSDLYAITSGTSMSSPAVAGAAALLLQRRPDLTQAAVVDLLQASARKANAEVRYGSQIGAGVLDLTNVVQVLDDEPDVGQPPSVAESFWYLGAESARPDRSWPVNGFVQLRRADGSLASGLDPTGVTVSVENGALVAEPVKVAHGLFQFAVAGLEGTGGTEMRVRVSYEGAPIEGERVLPVAIDQWAGAANPTVTGGLSCASASLGRERPLPWMIALLLVLARRRRPTAQATPAASRPPTNQ